MSRRRGYRGISCKWGKMSRQFPSKPRAVVVGGVDWESRPLNPTLTAGLHQYPSITSNPQSVSKQKTPRHITLSRESKPRRTAAKLLSRVRDPVHHTLTAPGCPGSSRDLSGFGSGSLNSHRHLGGQFERGGKCRRTIPWRVCLISDAPREALFNWAESRPEAVAGDKKAITTTNDFRKRACCQIKY